MSDLVGNPEVRFSRVEAHLFLFNLSRLANIDKGLISNYNDAEIVKDFAIRFKIIICYNRNQCLQ